MASRHELGEPVVVVTGVEKFFGAFAVLKDVSLTVRRGETVCIIGPSGSGKSTLLRCINGLVPMWDPLESTCRHASLSIL